MPSLSQETSNEISSERIEYNNILLNLLSVQNNHIPLCQDVVSSLCHKLNKRNISNKDFANIYLLNNTGYVSAQSGVVVQDNTTNFRMSSLKHIFPEVCETKNVSQLDIVIENKESSLVIPVNSSKLILPVTVRPLDKGRVYFPQEAHWDSGADMGATGNEDMLDAIVTNVHYNIDCVLGKATIKESGRLKFFNQKSLLVKGLNIIIVSASQHTVGHYIGYSNRKDAYFSWEKGDDPKHFYVFQRHKGGYVTNCQYSLEFENIEQILDTLPVPSHSPVEQSVFHVFHEECEGTFLDFVSIDLSEDLEFAKRSLSSSSTAMDYNVSTLKAVMFIRNLHRGMGHPGIEQMERLIKYVNLQIEEELEKEDRKKMRIPENARMIITFEHWEVYRRVFDSCDTCHASKMVRDLNQDRSNLQQQLRTVGYQGHIDWTFFGLRHNMFTCVDGFSKFAIILHSKRRTIEDAIRCLTLIQQRYKYNGHKLEHMLSDRDNTFTKDSFETLSLSLSQSPPEGHESTVEIFTRFLWYIVLAMKRDLGYEMPESMYTRIFSWAVDTHNMKVNKEGKTPFEIFTGRKVNPNHMLTPFGCWIMAGHKNSVSNWEEKADVGVVVGRDLDSNNTIHFLNVRTNEISARSVYKRCADPKIYYHLMEKLVADKPFVVDTSDAESLGLSNETSPEPVVPVELTVPSNPKPDVFWPDDKPWTSTKTQTIEKILFHYKKPNDPNTWYALKWKGYVRHSQKWDSTASGLQDLFSRADLAPVPSEKEYSETNILINILKEVTEEIQKEDEIFPGSSSYDTGVFGNELPEGSFEEGMEENFRAFFSKPEHTHLVTGALTAKEGLRLEPTLASESMDGELKNLHDFHTWTCVHFNSVPPEERKNIIKSFMFLKFKYGLENILDKIKSRYVGRGDMENTSHLSDDQISATTLSF